MNTPQLLAKSFGMPCQGPHKCYYCGAPCTEENPVSQFVKPSFSERTQVVIPASAWVCNGCVLCFRESCEVTQIDGQTRAVSKGAMRSFCWVITESKALAATKAHLDRLREVCLNGLPAQCWSIVLTDAGQKHFLYRAAVQLSPSPPWVANLDGEPIWYHPDSLRSRLRMSGRLAAVLGKPSLASPLRTQQVIKILETYPDGEEMVVFWNSNLDEPLSRLATWLCPNKETCEREYLANTVPK